MLSRFTCGFTKVALEGADGKYTLGAGLKLLQDLPLPLLWGTQDIGRMAARGWGRAEPGSEVSQRSRNWGS